MSKLMSIGDITMETPNLGSSRVEIRVLRLWIPMTKLNKEACIDMILVDKEGSQIEAVTDIKSVYKFKKLLKEGGTFSISDFKVQNNVKKEWQMAIVQHDFKIQIEFNTDVKTITDTILARNNGFRFVPFRKIKTDTVTETFYVDIIGEISSWRPIEERKFRNGTTGRIMKLTLVDLEGHALEVTLWETLGDDVEKYMSGRENSSLPTILILQFGKKNDYNGEISVTSVKYTTKILLNADIPDVKNFLERRSDMGVVSIDGSVSQVTTEHRSQSQWDWLNVDRHRTISQLGKLEAGFYTIKVYLKGPDVNAVWYYNACGICNGKVKQNTKVGELCSNPRCNKQITAIVPRFYPKFIVTDPTGETRFIFFESLVKQFIEQSAEDVLELLKKDGCENCYPDVFDDIFKREYICKVRVHEYFNIQQKKDEYSVDVLTSDIDLIKQFDRVAQTEVDSLKNNIDQATVDAPNKKKVDSTDEVDSCGSNNSHVPPMKRSIMTDNDAKEDADVQRSVSKVIKKVMKKEKH